MIITYFQYFSLLFETLLFCNFRANLAVVQELGDKAAKGRACGNLGNTYYLLGLFEEAVQYHQLVRDNLIWII